MFIQIRTIEVTKGHADQVVERFTKESPLDTMEGLLDKTVMVNRKKQEHEEILVMIRWESVEAWKNWEKSDAHLEGHRQNRGKPLPEYVIRSTVNMYEVAAIKEGPLMKLYHEFDKAKK